MVKAHIALAPGQAPLEGWAAEIQRLVKENLARHEFLLTSTGTIRRGLLRRKNLEKEDPTGP